MSVLRYRARHTSQVSLCDYSEHAVLWITDLESYVCNMMKLKPIICIPFCDRTGPVVMAPTPRENVTPCLRPAYDLTQSDAS
jgi:hypothetical protein